MNPQTKKLIMVVPGSNNNKFYHMIYTGGDSFSVEYGRVGVSKQLETYPVSKWNSKYNEKIKKGYKDQTDLFVEDVSIVQPNLATSNTPTVQDVRILVDLYNYANKSIKENYTVSVESVTKKQVNTAQSIIDDISSNVDLLDMTTFNDKLVDLFSIIPRRMKAVSDHLLKLDDKTEKSKIITREQSVIDTMMGQVNLNQQNKNTANAPTDSVSLADKLGININEVLDANVVDMIKNMMGDSKNLFSCAYEIAHPKTKDVFSGHVEAAQNKDVQLLWHGSRNQNWFNILQTGLLIRPSGVVLTGAAFGNGIYFANKAKKSIGYTSIQGSYWSKGNDNKAYLAIFDVHTGNPYHAYKWKSEYGQLDKPRLNGYGAYDSVYAHGGYDLINDEFIVYTTQQCTIKYIVEIKQ